MKSVLSLAGAVLIGASMLASPSLAQSTQGSDTQGNTAAGTSTQSDVDAGSTGASVGGTDTTASTSAGAQGSSSTTAMGAFDPMSPDAAPFFSDEARTTLRTQEEIAAAYANLTEEQRTGLETTCTDVKTNATNYSQPMTDLCGMVEGM